MRSGASGPGLLVLSGRELCAALHPKSAIDALRETYRVLAEHPGDGGQSLGFAVEGGSIHVKAGLLPGSHLAFAAKVNVNRPDNRDSFGLPTIQGVVILADVPTGRPLAILDSAALTAVRTAATAALAAGYGASPGSETIAIIGCGLQAQHLLTAFQAAFPLRELRAFDALAGRAEEFVRAAAESMPRCRAVSTVHEAVQGAQICITCTTSSRPVLTADMDLAGAFVAAVGADNPSKQEIDPELMRRARLLVDDLDACAANGDLYHAIKAGMLTRESVHAELAALAAGTRRGRERAEELVIFDSTGSGVQDVAIAWAVYHAARAARLGLEVNLSGG
jgi:ornithine cyclodeaminase/alanine dehydrogenase-like protein (mu-crystallin family)